MALIDVSFLLDDPDFTDSATLITREISVNGFGEGVLAEVPSTITAVIQGSGTESLELVPEGARLSDLIDVYYAGILTVERPGGYADIVEWRGKRYQVKEVVEDFINYGTGFTHAICMLESVNA